LGGGGCGKKSKKKVELDFGVEISQDAERILSLTAMNFILTIR